MASYRRLAFAGLAGSLLLVATVGYFALTRNAPHRFDSCEITDDVLVLTFGYGVGDSPEVRFDTFGNHGPVTYRDGTPLACAGATRAS